MILWVKYIPCAKLKNVCADQKMSPQAPSTLGQEPFVCQFWHIILQPALDWLSYGLSCIKTQQAESWTAALPNEHNPDLSILSFSHFLVTLYTWDDSLEPKKKRSNQRLVWNAAPLEAAHENVAPAVISSEAWKDNGFPLKEEAGRHRTLEYNWSGISLSCRIPGPLALGILPTRSATRNVLPRHSDTWPQIKEGRT